jgi:hypothetical protein
MIKIYQTHILYKNIKSYAIYQILLTNIIIILYLIIHFCKIESNFIL